MTVCLLQAAPGPAGGNGGERRTQEQVEDALHVEVRRDLAALYAPVP
ncbi:MAG: hypothetical protein ACLP7W_10645 [Solirubrobacteraceae bacterium]